MSKLRWLAILMVVAIAGITGFQVYWLKENYDREKQSLDIKANSLFRQTILSLQASKLKLDELKIKTDSAIPKIRVSATAKPRKPSRVTWTESSVEPPITIVNLLQEKSRIDERRDSLHGGRVYISGFSDTLSRGFRDSIRKLGAPGTIRSIVLSRDMVDSASETISEMRVKGEPEPKNRVMMRFNSDDTILNTKQDIVIESSMSPPPEFRFRRATKDSSRNAFFRMVYSIDSLSIRDSVTLKEISESFAARLKAEKMNLTFGLAKFDSSYGNSKSANEVTVGLSAPMTFKLTLLNSSGFILKKLQLLILFSLLLVGITIASFVLLYRNLLRQHRLSQMKNDLISNITHELKTPIATVGVAIEALKNFNAIHDPERTKEYLDISQNELHRLELLVDKVLKLSMFENKQVGLQKEEFDLQLLVKEVAASLKFQADKQKAKLTIESTGDRFLIHADKLHVTSVIYNLIDNALKYSRENPEVNVSLISHPQHVELQVKDNGIGIPPQYTKKIFDKFFRVPAGDKHTTKGYGLGLSYVDHIVKTHHGFIEVNSELGKGSTFIVNIPFRKEGQDDFGNGRTITKENFPL